MIRSRQAPTRCVCSTTSTAIALAKKGGGNGNLLSGQWADIGELKLVGRFGQMIFELGKQDAKEGIIDAEQRTAGKATPGMVAYRDIISVYAKQDLSNSGSVFLFITGMVGRKRQTFYIWNRQRGSGFPTATRHLALTLTRVPLRMQPTPSRFKQFFVPARK